VLADLGRRQMTSLFLEGGATLASAFIESNQVDEARIFVAPILLGGAARTGGDPPTGPVRLAALSSEVETVGDDVLIKARFKEW
jgi:diaminohydroxyphosphoribosylaminopyrimidine deaminase/5-amino-6-(5-phosphoribosylamino)uracil reductase